MAYSIAAIATQKGSRQHKRYGRYFFYAMTGIFITAIPMAIMKSNTFLFLIAIFSYYLAYTGWRYARHRENTIPKSDWFVCLMMLAASTIMMVMGVREFNLENTQSIVLIIFGLLGAIFSFNDARLYYQNTISTTTRIVKHLGAMLGGTIAIYTAFLVTNVRIGSPIILWLGLTFLISPVIIYWTRKVEQKKGLFDCK
ncbi:hypothetical protein TUM19329_30750 [Legionella antarctica]|uniref:Uncharacterized protein n=1 Tax=Legionella antarctica TaxID=2708020 RepID=A0A6F8T7Q2_9GAMM|nr:hypothetical protein [Legionella antarctica]BCA96714.1 hypothetical protein TUM19329_30750 [Legionella antarctica]